MHLNDHTDGDDGIEESIIMIQDFKGANEFDTNRCSQTQRQEAGSMSACAQNFVRFRRRRNLHEKFTLQFHTTPKGEVLGKVKQTLYSSVRHFASPRPLWGREDMKANARAVVLIRSVKGWDTGSVFS